MKIGHPADKPAAAAAGAPAAARRPSRPGASQPAATAGAADPSATGRPFQLRRHPVVGGAAGEFDAEKVARMSEAIASAVSRSMPRRSPTS
jgi:hypothetical protein